MEAKILCGSREYKLATSSLFLGSIAAFGLGYGMQPLIQVFGKIFQLEPAIASLGSTIGTGAMAIAMIFVASFANIIPRKIAMITALIVPAIMDLFLANCGTFRTILIFRFIQGFFVAGYLSMAIAYISEEFDEKIIGRVMGIYIAGTTMGGLLGRIILSTLTDMFDWQTGLKILGTIYLMISLIFLLTLPKPKHQLDSSAKKFKNFLGLFKNFRLIRAYLITSLVVGAFECSYNFIPFILLSENYNLIQRQIGLIYLLFLFGTISSAIMGRLSDSVYKGKVVFLSIIVLLLGILVTEKTSLFMKLSGLALITYGVFGAHSTLAAWVGKLDDADKAQISAVYNFFFFLGSFTIGSSGGIFLLQFGWNGIVGFLLTVSLLALILCVTLFRKI